MMEKYFCNYNQSLALKELGFDESCLSEFWKRDDGEIFPMSGNELFELKYQKEKTSNVDDMSFIINRPLKSQVFEWFREKHNLRSNIMDFIDDVTGIEWDYEIDFIGVDLDERGNYIPLVDYSIDDETRKFKTYEEAESACIDKLIEIIKSGL